MPDILYNPAAFFSLWRGCLQPSGCRVSLPGPRYSWSWGHSQGRSAGSWGAAFALLGLWTASTSGQAVGPPGGGSCVGSVAPARLLQNSQTFGNLGIAIPKVNSRQLTSIPGMQRNPTCARGSRFVRLPFGLQFPRGKRNPEGGGLRYALARSAAGSAGPGWPFLPLPEIFRPCVCKSPIASKALGPFGVGGGGAVPAAPWDRFRLGDSGPECLCVRHRKRHILGPFFAECPGVLVSVPCAHAQRRHARKRKFPECRGPTRVTVGSDFIFFQTGGIYSKNQHPSTDFRKQSAIFQRFGAAVLWGYYTASNRCLKSLCGLFLFPSERRY